MKRYLLSATTIAAVSLLIGNASFAQDTRTRDVKEKSKNKLDQYDEIIIKKKGDKDDKVTIEIKNGEVFVDGKAIDEFEDDNISVRKRKPAVIAYNSPASPFRSGGSWNYSGGDDFNLTGETRAFLGVSTTEGTGGAKITQITSGSAAEKAGLKKGDIITKIDDIKISDHEDIATEIRKRKPEEKVLISINRDGKEQKISATLGKTKTTVLANGGNLMTPRALESFDFGNSDMLRAYGVVGRPRLGIRAQDTEDEKGAKVLDVADESIAEKAGIKKDDVITEFDGKSVNNADDLSAAAKDSREKPSIKVKLNRGGTTQNVEIKIPKNLKTTNL